MREDYARPIGPPRQIIDWSEISRRYKAMGIHTWEDFWKYHAPEVFDRQEERPVAQKTNNVPDTHIFGFGGSKDGKKHCFDKKKLLAPCGKRAVGITEGGNRPICTTCAAWVIRHN